MARCSVRGGSKNEYAPRTLAFAPGCAEPPTTPLTYSFQFLDRKNFPTKFASAISGFILYLMRYEAKTSSLGSVSFIVYVAPVLAPVLAITISPEYSLYFSLSS